MHYIRILRPPRFTKSSKDGSTKNVFPRLDTKITIATDLGDSFFCHNIQLTVTLLTTVPLQVGALAQNYLWKGAEGMRALEVQIPIPARQKSQVKQRVQVWIRATERELSVESFVDVLRDRPGVMPVGSVWIEVETEHSTAENVNLMERVLVTGDGRKVPIWEEMGESIARHVWDAGLVLSAWIAHTLCPKLEIDSLAPLECATRLPFLTRFLHAAKSENSLGNGQPLRIIELGAGCGMVSLTFLACLNLSASSISAVLTDLPVASEILATNIASCIPKRSRTFSNMPLVTGAVLDWSDPLPLTISAIAWDAVLVADCTYNPDVVPDLVATLGRIRDRTRILREEAKFQHVTSDKGTTVILALKERHETERVFFSLMKNQRWTVLEQCQVVLPMITNLKEEIRIFVFVSL